ncbi:Phosphoesterase PHP, N-terminal precursor [Chitinispirillum alkaliphilum]|nr:Phosphoesterase PHP, N-terminal precursor [Chitinispirillum alkaliphilum]
MRLQSVTLIISILFRIAITQSLYINTLVNPYESVDWETFGQYKANLHTHTTQSDGKYTPDQTIDIYRERGYQILSITDHNKVTWPWSAFGRDPSELNMIAIEGNEISNTHHLGSYFCSFNSTTSDELFALSEIGALGGLAVLFHPGRYNLEIDWYVNLYKNHPHLVGLEVINQEDRYKGDRLTWDAILSELLPERMVWGFANDDMHRDAHIAKNWNVFLLPELNGEEVRKAMENGTFYFSSNSTIYGTDGAPPVINSIYHDKTGSILSVSAENTMRILWISQGKAIAEGPFLAYNDITIPGNYVRAQLTGPGGESFTQPFTIIKEKLPAVRNRTLCLNTGLGNR